VIAGTSAHPRPAHRSVLRAGCRRPARRRGGEPVCPWGAYRQAALPAFEKKPGAGGFSSSAWPSPDYARAPVPSAEGRVLTMGKGRQ
jgi:hypothetical protein